MSRYYLYPTQHITQYRRQEADRIEVALMMRKQLQERTGIAWRIIQDTGIGAAPG